MKESLTLFSKKELADIHSLSRGYNGSGDKPHAEVLLRLMAKHIEEVSQRYREKDEHYVVEAGDLVVLCFELMLEAGYEPDEIMIECYNRYRKKFTSLLEKE